MSIMTDYPEGVYTDLEIYVQHNRLVVGRNEVVKVGEVRRVNDRRPEASHRV